MQLKVNLNSIEKVKEFVKKTEQLTYNADLASGRYVVDAKSLLGIFSLDLTKDVSLVLHADDGEAEEFVEWLKDNGYIA